MGAGGSTFSKGSTKAALVDVAIAVSLANLCYLPAWYETIRVSLNPEAQWASYSRNGCIAAMLGVLLFAAVMWVDVYEARRRRSLIALRDTAFLGAWLHIAMAIVQGEAQAAVRSISEILGPIRVPVALLSLATIRLLVWSTWRHRLVAAGRTAALLLAPFVLFTFSQSAWLLPQFITPDPAPLAPPAEIGPPRVVWVVFDELDYRLAFVDRPADLSLPELDRLRATAVAADSAYPPADTTLLSIPALLTGRVVAISKPAGPADRILELATHGASTQSVRWSDAENVFRRARRLGVNSGLTGWYHPYDRILGDDLARCSSRANDSSITNAMSAQVKRIATTPPLGWLTVPLLDTVRGPAARHEHDVQRHREILADAIAMTSDPQLGLVFVHASIPHLPIIYDRHSGTLQGTSEGSYFDNLALVDLSFGELRRSLEAAGAWDATVVLVTSDHALKAKRLNTKLPDPARLQHDRRVPFLLKMPYQRNGIVFAKPFNTVITERLILAILDGTVTDAAAATEWLDAHAQQ